MKKIFVLIISIFCLFNIYLCNNKKDIINFPKGNNCDSINIKYLLVQDIIKKPYIYTYLSKDTFQFFYLISNGLVPNGKEFQGPVRKVITIEEKDINKIAGSTIYFDSLYSNKYTSEVKIKVDFLALNKVMTTSSTFRYKFDFDRCTWLIIDSTFIKY